MISAERKRRSSRAAVLAAAAVVAALNGYVCLWMAVSHAAHHGQISSATANAAAPLFQPVVGYCTKELPGARLLSSMWWNVNPPKSRFVPLVGVAEIPAPFAPPKPLVQKDRTKGFMIEMVEPGGYR